MSGRLLYVFGDSVEPEGDTGIYSIALSPDGKLMASAGTRSAIDLWQLD
jgi:hypothetical protein